MKLICQVVRQLTELMPVVPGACEMAVIAAAIHQRGRLISRDDGYHRFALTVEGVVSEQRGEIVISIPGDFLRFADWKVSWSEESHPELTSHPLSLRGLVQYLIRLTELENGLSLGAGNPVVSHLFRGAYADTFRVN